LPPRIPISPTGIEVDLEASRMLAWIRLGLPSSCLYVATVRSWTAYVNGSRCHAWIAASRAQPHPRGNRARSVCQHPIGGLQAWPGPRCPPTGCARLAWALDCQGDPRAAWRCDVFPLAFRHCAEWTASTVASFWSIVSLEVGATSAARCTKAHHAAIYSDGLATPTVAFVRWYR